jgi:hypothetical protein
MDQVCLRIQHEHPVVGCGRDPRDPSERQRTVELAHLEIRLDPPGRFGIPSVATIRDDLDAA